MFCPHCKKRIKHVDVEKTENENYICNNCKSKWLIIYEGEL